jgi:N-acetylglucosaminyldiphosphoundecaprenol N-acetyl-beta-D-mannosaminyltransferase
MIPLCSRFDSVLFTPKMSAIASYGNYSRSPYVIEINFQSHDAERAAQIAQDDPDFRHILNSAAMNTLDGQPVVWLARWRKFDVERVTGRELVWDVVADYGAQIRHVLFGSTSSVTDEMIARLRQLNPKVQVDSFNPPFGPLGDDKLNDICRQLISAGPMIIWVGLSTPKQERLAVRLSKSFPSAPIVAIGAGFDFVANLKPCPPTFVKLLCLEWLFRLASDPRRLFKRYAKIVPRFLLLLGREIIVGPID